MMATPSPVFLPAAPQASCVTKSVGGFYPSKITFQNVSNLHGLAVHNNRPWEVFADPSVPGTLHLLCKGSEAEQRNLVHVSYNGDVIANGRFRGASEEQSQEDQPEQQTKEDHADTEQQTKEDRAAFNEEAAQSIQELRELFERAQKLAPSQAFHADACLRSLPFLLIKEALERQRKSQVLQFGDDVYQKIFEGHLEPLSLKVVGETIDKIRRSHGEIDRDVENELDAKLWKFVEELRDQAQREYRCELDWVDVFEEVSDLHIIDDLKKTLRKACSSVEEILSLDGSVKGISETQLYELKESAERFLKREYKDADWLDVFAKRTGLELTAGEKTALRQGGHSSVKDIVDAIERKARFEGIQAETLSGIYAVAVPYLNERWLIKTLEILFARETKNGKGVGALGVGVLEATRVALYHAPEVLLNETYEALATKAHTEVDFLSSVDPTMRMHESFFCLQKFVDKLCPWMDYLHDEFAFPRHPILAYRVCKSSPDMSMETFRAVLMKKDNLKKLFPEACIQTSVESLARRIAALSESTAQSAEVPVGKVGNSSSEPARLSEDAPGDIIRTSGSQGNVAAGGSPVTAKDRGWLDEFEKEMDVTIDPGVERILLIACERVEDIILVENDSGLAGIPGEVREDLYKKASDFLNRKLAALLRKEEERRQAVEAAKSGGVPVGHVGNSSSEGAPGDIIRTSGAQGNVAAGGSPVMKLQEEEESDDLERTKEREQREAAEVQDEEEQAKRLEEDERNRLVEEANKRLKQREEEKAKRLEDEQNNRRANVQDEEEREAKLLEGNEQTDLEKLQHNSNMAATDEEDGKDRPQSNGDTKLVFY